MNNKLQKVTVRSSYLTIYIVGRYKGNVTWSLSGVLGNLKSNKNKASITFCPDYNVLALSYI